MTEKSAVTLCFTTAVLFLLNFGMAFAQAGVSLAAPSPPRVTIDSGTLQGAYFGPNSDEATFLGIPYAAAPTGQRRWRPPQPVEPWAGALIANSFGPACPQPDDPDVDMTALQEDLAKTIEPYFTFRTDEDCLFLNVWTTNLPASGGSTKKFPVMVWIHGGANVEGSGQLPPFGPTLARKGVVLVSINYRLGALGFMAHPALTAESDHHSSGNYGLLDQVAALQWVQRNIGILGGDTGNVTIFGESAGGVDVCYLMSSPLARGLFQRAILQSCTCRGYISAELKRFTRFEGGSGTAEQIGVRLMHALNIAEGPDALAKMRAKTAKEILDAPGPDQTEFYESGGVVDGWVIPEQPAKLFAEGRQMKVPVIAGSNADEATVFVEGVLGKTPTVAGYRSYVREHFADHADEVLRAYPAATDQNAASAFIALNTDYIAGEDVQAFATNTEQAGEKAWLYYFSYPAREADAALGAYHGIELDFVSGWLSPRRWGKTNEEDRKIIELMTGYWVQFAKTGDPNGRALPEWPVYNSKKDQLLEIGHAVRVRATPHAERFAVFERSLKSKLATASAR